MNADILERVVRPSPTEQSDLVRLAGKIVEAERKTGHIRLAAVELIGGEAPVGICRSIRDELEYASVFYAGSPRHRC